MAGAGVELDFQRVTRLLNEPGILERVKLEDYLLVALGVRGVSLVTIPAELPDGQELGRAIDRTFSLLYYRGGDPGRPLLARLAHRGRDVFYRLTLNPLQYKATLMAHAFSRVVTPAPSYQAHRAWARDLGLDCFETAVRPTIHELYLYRDPAVLRRLQELMDERRRIHVAARAEYRPTMGAAGLVYPEEYRGEYLERLGELLGYPACCVQRYARDRTARVSVELRAAKQLEVARKAGPAAVDPDAYWVKDFFPCRPDCPAAGERGRQAANALRELDPRLADRYRRGMEKNLERVAEYPAAIRAHELRLRDRVRRQLERLEESEAEPAEEEPGADGSDDDGSRADRKGDDA